MQVETMDDYARKGSVNRDRLSELPDSLIHLIFSFLSMRDVVSTSLLSKRWNNLWTTVPCLRFDEVIHDGAIERVRNFVNRALFMWSGTNILKFEISIDNVFDSSLADDIDLWMRFAVKCKVEELEIHLCYGFDYSDLMMENTYRIPQCLYSCSSLRKLSLSGFNLQICGPPSWNQLKSLEIRSSRLSELSSNRIMLGSPQLEVFVLSLREDCGNLSIMSTSLKKLWILRLVCLPMDISALDTDTVFRICCPNLEIFQYFGSLYGKCLFTNVASLIDATLLFEANFNLVGDVDYLRLNEMLGEALRQVFSSRVEKLELSSMCVRWCLQVVDASPEGYLLSPSVKFLTLEAGDIHEFGDMMDVLGIFPNIKMLVIEDLAITTPPDLNAVEEFEANLPSNSVLPQLKTVEIISRRSDVSSIFGFIEFLLKHAIKLEKLVLRFTCITSYPQRSLLQISEKLLSMPRSSPRAKVILKSIT